MNARVKLRAQHIKELYLEHDKEKKEAQLYHQKQVQSKRSSDKKEGHESQIPLKNFHTRNNRAPISTIRVRKIRK